MRLHFIQIITLLHHVGVTEWSKLGTQWQGRSYGKKILTVDSQPYDLIKTDLSLHVVYRTIMILKKSLKRFLNLVFAF